MAKNFKRLRGELDERLDALPAGEGDAIRERVAARYEAELTAHELSLSDMRKARRLTQSQLAAALGVTQAQVSRIEHQTDFYLSTLTSYVEAMGGGIEITGVFTGPEGEPVRMPLILEDLVDDDADPDDLMAELERKVTAGHTAPAALLGAALAGSTAVKTGIHGSIRDSDSDVVAPIGRGRRPGKG